MKQRILLFLFSAVGYLANAQSAANFYGVARTTTSTPSIYFAKVNPATGVVTNISSSTITSTINLTGAALNPYANTFHFMGGNEIKTVDVATGNLVRSVAISNASGAQYFDNFRFNNSDSTLYGIAKRVYSVDSAVTSEIFLAKLNPTTGVVTNVSTTPVGYGAALSSGAIDPYYRVYYFSTGTELVGLDMYTGGIYSNVRIATARGIGIDNLAYSCADTFLYGLVRENYYDTVYIDSTTYYETVDSTTLELAKIDPRTGYVTIISPSSIASGGYSLNSGATIDPDSLIYYYNNGYELVGVSMVTGRIVAQNTLYNADGDLFELMRIPNNCIRATSTLRSAPTRVGITEIGSKEANVRAYPNPVNDVLQIATEDDLVQCTLYNALGQQVLSVLPGIRGGQIDVSGLACGTYTLKIQTKQSSNYTTILKQ